MQHSFNTEITKEFIITEAVEFEKELYGVYFLIKNNEIVYIGKTSKGLSRVFKHISDKDYDKYYFMPVSKDNLDYTECECIVKFKPKYNTSLNSCSLSMESLKRHLRSLGKIHDKRVIKRIMKDNGIIPEIYGTMAYVTKNQFDKIIDLMGVEKDVTKD